jgi:hypothetical protein
MRNFFIHKNFYSDYRKLRGEFESNFRDSKSTHQKRFVWDFWYDEDQYHLIRTPAFYYFNKKNYRDFHSYLVQWGRENLGCHDISPPWLSYYVDGCYQNLHSDVPHGPWAFVYSLTPEKKSFRGGETLILKPETLDYWPQFSDSEPRDYAYHNFVERIPSQMNQLLIFDPRFPHGVTEVKGTRDPLKSRLVVHGWFVNPRPYVTGGLKTAQVERGMREALRVLSEELSRIGLLNGALSVRLKIGRGGEVTDYRALTDTLISVEKSPADVLYLQKQLKNIFKSIKFPDSKLASQVTIPLVFR